MRLMVMIVSVPLAGLFTWWGVSGVRGGSSSKATETFTVERKNFSVKLQEKGELKAIKSIDIKSEVSGRSTIISLIPEGSNVKKGDLLVELASEEIEEKIQTEEIQVTNARASYESAKNQLDILREKNQSEIGQAALALEMKQIDFEKYEKGDWLLQKKAAEIRVDEAQLLFERAENDLKNSEELKKRDFITQSDLEDHKFDRIKKENDKANASRELELLLTYTRPKDKKQKQSDVDEAMKELERVKKGAVNKEQEQEAKLKASEQELELKEQQLKKWKEQKEKSKIYAPADGLVVYGDGGGGRWGNDNQIKEGAEVIERQTLLQLPDTSRMKVVIRIHEAQTDRVKPEQKAIVTVEGVSQRKFTGTISKIAVLADSMSSWLNPELKEYETEITLDESDELFKPGVTAHVEILVAELTDVLAAPVQTVFSKGGRSYVFVGESSKQAEPVEVQLGLASEEFVEIKSGVEPGQAVLLAINDGLKHKLPEVQVTEEAAQQQPASPSAQPAGERKGSGGGMSGGRRSGGGGGGGGRRGSRG